MKKFLLIILVISLSLSCLLVAAEQMIFNIGEYAYAYDEYNIGDATGKDWLEIRSITKDILKYLKIKAGDEILQPNFNEREVLHMRDVQVLFKYGFILKYLSLGISLAVIILFVMQGERELVGRYIYKGLFINWIFLGILLAMIYFDFNKYFTYFHEIFFSNDLWLLDPRTDLLIQMLPEEFFLNMARKIGLLFGAYVATIQGIGYTATKKGRGNHEKRNKIFKRKS